MLTLSPRSFSRRPRLEAVRPLPRLDATPPVTNRCLVETGREKFAAVAKTSSRGPCPAASPPVHGVSEYQPAGPAPGRNTQCAAMTRSKTPDIRLYRRARPGLAP